MAEPATRFELVRDLVPKLVAQFQDVLQEEGEAGLSILFENFLQMVPNQNLQGLYLAFSLIDLVEVDLVKQAKRVRRAMPCIITENLEDEEMPSGVRDYLIVGWCDAGRIIAPVDGCFLYLLLPEKKDPDSEMIMRDYRLDTPDSTRYFVEYYSHKTSAFDNGWSQDKGKEESEA